MSTLCKVGARKFLWARSFHNGTPWLILSLNLLKGPGAGSVQFGRIKADRVNATSFATGRPRKEEFLQMSSFLRQPTALQSRKGTYKLFKSSCEKSQKLKNVVKENRSRDHHHLQPFKLGASGLQRFCLGWSWKLICWKRPLWHLQHLLLCLRNGKEKPGEILALLAHLFLLLVTTLGNWARFRVQFVGCWEVLSLLF